MFYRLTFSYFSWILFCLAPYQICCLCSQVLTFIVQIDSVSVAAHHNVLRWMFLNTSSSINLLKSLTCVFKLTNDFHIAHSHGQLFVFILLDLSAALDTFGGFFNTLVSGTPHSRFSFYLISHHSAFSFADYSSFLQCLVRLFHCNLIPFYSIYLFISLVIS